MKVIERRDAKATLSALVAFLGTAGVGVSVAGGMGPAIGWFALAQGDVYWPSYNHDLGYSRALDREAAANPLEIRFDRKA